MPKPPTPITSRISNSPRRVPTGNASLASGKGINAAVVGRNDDDSDMEADRREGARPRGLEVLAAVAMGR